MTLLNLNNDLLKYVCIGNKDYCPHYPTIKIIFGVKEEPKNYIRNLLTKTLLSTDSTTWMMNYNRTSD